MDDLTAWSDALSDELAQLPQSIPGITRVVIAQDRVSAQRARERLAAGQVSAEESVVLVGSYARLDYALRLAVEGLVSWDWLLDELPALWRGSDPDDTLEEYLDLWKRARARAGAVVRDDPASELPVDKDGYVSLFRGQREGDPIGIAWSTSWQIAQKFARGASLRVPVPDGEIIVAKADPSDVLAYLTGRGEHEVIIDPGLLR